MHVPFMAVAGLSSVQLALLTLNLRLQEVAASSDDGLTVAEIWDSLPTDPGSLVALVLMVAFVVVVVRFGTAGGKSKSEP